jgi:hypothetical protein
VWLRLKRKRTTKLKWISITRSLTKNILTTMTWSEKKILALAVRVAGMSKTVNLSPAVPRTKIKSATTTVKKKRIDSSDVVGMATTRKKEKDAAAKKADL